MVLWHTEFLKLRILKNQQKVTLTTTPSPHPKPFSPEAGFQHPPVRDALPVYRGKEHPYFQRQSMNKNPTKTGLTKFLPIYYNYLIFLNLFIFLHKCPLFIKPSIDIHRSKPFL